MSTLGGISRPNTRGPYSHQTSEAPMRAPFDESQSANDIASTTDRRFSKNDYTYQLLEKLDVAELRRLLNEIPASELKYVASSLHFPHLPHGAVTASQAEAVQTRALKLYLAGTVRKMFSLFVDDLVDRTEEILGDHHKNPSRRRVTKLTDSLLDEFGPLKTKIFYAIGIDSEVVAKRHLLKELSRRPELAIELFLHDETPVGLVDPRPAPSAEVRSTRKERRAELRKAKAVRRSQVDNSREQGRRWKKHHSPVIDTDVSNDVTQPRQPTVIQEVKLQHGHLRRYRKATTDHPDVGAIKSVFVSFGKDDPLEGKVRPCVLVAVAPNYYIVRPIYSRASYFAGKWRAVVLKDWSAAGLDHESVVGHQTHKVRRADVKRHVGALTIRDWNRVCRGEVNEVADV